MGRESLEDKANRLVEEGKVKHINTFKNSIFEVAGDSGNYSVIIGANNSTCTCKYFTLKGGLCSHILAARIYANKKGIKIPNISPQINNG